MISDLHLGHPACRVDSIEQLRPLFEGVATVVFNGDTIEQRSPLLIEYANQLFEQLKQLLDELNVAAIFLRGNHDPNISTTEYLELPEFNTLIIHGDCLYKSLSPWNPKIWKLEPQFEVLKQEIEADYTDFDSNLDTRLKYTQACRLIAAGDEAKSVKKRFKKIRSAIQLIYPFRRPVEILRCWIGHGGLVNRFRQQYDIKSRYLLCGHIHRPGIHSLTVTGTTGINTGGFLSLGSAHLVDFVTSSVGAEINVHKVDESGDSFRVGKKLKSFTIE